MKRIELKKLVGLIGPYPYNPYLIFLFFFSQFFSRFIPVIGFVPAGSERWKAGGLIILLSALPGVVFALGAFLLNRFRPWSSESVLFYILEVAFFLSINLLYLPLINSIIEQQLRHKNYALVPLTPAIVICTLILTLLALALMHQAERKITLRLFLASEFVEKLQAERDDLIEYDEKLRHQASQFLHDRVQSDLMVVGMKLRSISGQFSTEVNEVIDRAIHRLENTRSTDLRNLIQILTPNLEAGTLSSALDVLLEKYRHAMMISLEIDAATEKLDTNSKLGIFRIIEQSILNTLVHGPAKRVQISLITAVDYKTEIVIADDGPGVEIEKASAGVGSAIIDSWVGILNGTKEINSAPGHGYRLEITFPR